MKFWNKQKYFRLIVQLFFLATALNLLLDWFIRENFLSWKLNKLVARKSSSVSNSESQIWSPNFLDLVADRDGNYWDVWNIDKIQAFIDGPECYDDPQCRPKIVFLWDGHFEGVLKYNAFTADMVARGPLGERIMMSSLIRGLEHLKYMYLVVNSVEMYLAYYNVFADDLVTTFSSTGALGEAYNAGLFETVPTCNFLILDFWGSMKGVKDDVMVEGFEHSQYLTPYPDNFVNTFLGFIQDKLIDDYKNITKENSGLIWGKEGKYFHNDYSWDWTVFSKLKETFPALELYGTCKYWHPSEFPPDIKNLKPLARQDFLKMLASQKFFFGIGSPHDGPSALEALACGVPYINTVYGSESDDNLDVHKRRLDIVNALTMSNNEKSKKLFQRKSQHKYSEMFTEPYVYHVKKDDVDGLLKAVQKIIDRGPVPPMVPIDFTFETYVERLRAIMERKWCKNTKI